MAVATTHARHRAHVGTIGGQSIMAQAHSSLARIDRFGTLTTVSALGQIVGPVLGGVIIGHSEEPSLESTSSALLVAAWVFVAVRPPLRCAPAFRRRPSARAGPNACGDFSAGGACRPH